MTWWRQAPEHRLVTGLLLCLKASSPHCPGPCFLICKWGMMPSLSFRAQDSVHGGFWGILSVMVKVLEPSTVP